MNIQSKAVQRLLESALKDQAAPAYLFCGATGVGKRTAAYWFADQMVKSALDLIWVEPTINIKGELHNASSDEAKSQGQAIAQIRLEQLNLIRSQWGLNPHKTKRVVVIESAHLMTADVSSALLKVMEESVSTVFILTSDNEDGLLPTVRSRCQVVRFEPWDDQAFQQFVREKCPNLLDYPTLMAFTRGCPGQAITAVEITNGLDSQMKRDLEALSQNGWSILDSFQIIPGLAALGHQQTLWMLRYVQYSLWVSPPLELSLKRQGFSLVEECFNQVRSHCQIQSMWEALLWQLSVKKIAWKLELPVPKQD